MKDLMKSNIYDSREQIVVVGSCLKIMQPQAFEEIENMGLPVFEVCLEQTHINMVITKLLGMIRAKDITKVIFASVDKSPHCVQLHYNKKRTLNQLRFRVLFWRSDCNVNRIL